MDCKSMITANRERLLGLNINASSLASAVKSPVCLAMPHMQVIPAGMEVWRYPTVRLKIGILKGVDVIIVGDCNERAQKYHIVFRKP